MSGGCWAISKTGFQRTGLILIRYAIHVANPIGACPVVRACERRYDPGRIGQPAHSKSMNGTRWVIIDTETDGLRAPIHVVELSGQLMEGWERIGKPFRMLLNHDVSIPSEAVAIHGYTQGYLRLFGKPPSYVYSAFRNYAGDCPLVAHNLSYDWEQCLKPEWARLGVPQIGQRGFCCMMLARRLVSETSTYKLEALKQCFQLSPTKGHRAENDVLTVVELFQRVYRKRLEQAGLNTFDSIAAFAKRTPIAKCFEIIRAGDRPSVSPPIPKSWQVRNFSKNSVGRIEGC